MQFLELNASIQTKTAILPQRQVNIAIEKKTFYSKLHLMYLHN